MTKNHGQEYDVKDMIFGRRYRMTEKIGSGGMAEVYKAVDEVLGRTVAVKVLHARYSQDPTFVARFRQEAHAAANLSHPTIVNIYDSGQEGDLYYIVMEYVRGTDLKSLIEQRGAVDPLKAAEYASQVCSALSVAHGYDIIHRDIKPHNIVLTPDGAVKVTDFGIARAGNTTMTQTGSVLGTAHYVSPEQAQGRNLTPGSDLYSLGVVLYELTTGSIPFDADTPVAVALKQVNEQPVPPRQLNPEIPEDLERIILRALRKNPTERYASADEMRQDLRRFIDGRRIETPDYDETTTMPRTRDDADTGFVDHGAPRKKRSTAWIWVVVAILLLAAGLGTAWALGLIGQTSVKVPSLAGMTPAEAERTLVALGLELGEVAKRHDEKVAAGKIADQMPTANATVEKGTKIKVFVSLGVELIVVPDLVGMEENEAIAALREQDFELEAVQREHSANTTEGTIVRQIPDPGAKVSRSTGVVLIVSRGPELVKIPSMIGKTASEAKQLLSRAGLRVKITEEYNNFKASGIVLSHSPQAGALVESGATVTLVLSMGPETLIMPNVLNKSEAEATTLLEELDFGVKVIYEVGQEGIVFNQNPVPDQEVKRGNIVTIYVGQAPATP